jgi:hypothetical protein
MKCYLDLENESEIIRDQAGIEVASIDEARAEILGVLADELEADPNTAADWSGWTLRVVDSARQLIFSIVLTDLPSSLGSLRGDARCSCS